jgi:hypothetical protein
MPKDKVYAGDKLSEGLQRALASIVDQFETEEKAVRERQIRLWKKLEFYWASFTRIWWDDTAHDWRIFDDGHGYGQDESAYYDKQLNVFRAYLESIIAALSSSVPPVKFYPDDADNELDITTARGASKIADLISKHNDFPLLWIKALFVYSLQGMIAAYNYTKEDKAYGEIEIPEFEDQPATAEMSICPNCQNDISLEAINLMEDEKFEFDPDNEDAELHSELNKGKIICPQCAALVDPEIRKENFIVQRLTGTTKQAKSRQCVEVNGGLYVSVPNWARCQEDVPYLGYCYETHYVNVFKRWNHLRGNNNIVSNNTSSGAGGNSLYERWGRLSPQYYGEYPIATPTIRNWWLRPAAFEVIQDDRIYNELKKKFPDGCRVIWVNDQFAEASNENLDDHWTLTFNPLSEYIHFDPLGMLLTSIQEMTQDLTSLTLQTIEHGVPQVFADPSVLNFNQYSNSEIAPGTIVPAKVKTGKNLADSFYMLTTATLSQEVEPFSNQIQSMGQFISGALPSIWGGAEAGGTSRTAAQASMSRNQALQRLQNTWKMLNYWWARIHSKVVPAYIKYMLDDERLVKEEYGCYINDWIKRSELEGKIGNVEAEAADQLPATWGQIKDTVMQLIQTNNPEILQMLGAPENLGILQKAIGLEGFNAPGEHDREKQYYEINQLLKSQPLDNMQPSVMPEFEVDNHQVEGEICRDWLVSEQGRFAKLQNPEGYQNVLLHLKTHIQMNQMLQSGMTDPSQQNQNQPQSPQENQPPQETPTKPQGGTAPKLKLLRPKSNNG